MENHLAIPVKNLEESRKFYEKLEKLWYKKTMKANSVRFKWINYNNDLSLQNKFINIDNNKY